MASPSPLCYTDISSKKTKTEEYALKYVLTMILAMAAILAAQTGLSSMIGFHTAELLGKTAVSALFWYSIIRLIQAARSARA